MLLALVFTCLRGDPVAAPAPAPAPPAPVPVPVSPSVLDALAGPAAPSDLDVMTFNLRYASSVGSNTWAQRRPVMRDLLRDERPDLIGTQEGLTFQLNDIRADLGPAYDWTGKGRDGGDLGEHMAIFFDTTRLSPVRSGDYWLSTTPEVPASRSWDTAHVRMVTWVLFEDRRTGRRFYAVNTHLDNMSESAREHGAQLILRRLAAFDPLPVVLTGDFNSPGEASPVHRLLTGAGGLRDTWTGAPLRGPAYATIHNYQALIPDGERDDWILTTSDVGAVATLMNTYRGGGTQYPSDHLPIQARLRLP